MHEVNHNYYLSKDELPKSCLLTLRDIILKQDECITESFKWKLPCFSYRNKMFCFLNIDKTTGEPYMLFVEGEYLDHPELEKGKRSRMKIFRIDPNEDLPIRKIEELLGDALELYRSGTIKTK